MKLRDIEVGGLYTLSYGALAPVCRRISEVKSKVEAYHCGGAPADQPEGFAEIGYLYPTGSPLTQVIPVLWHADKNKWLRMDGGTVVSQASVPQGWDKIEGDAPRPMMQIVKVRTRDDVLNADVYHTFKLVGGGARELCELLLGVGRVLSVDVENVQ